MVRLRTGLLNDTFERQACLYWAQRSGGSWDLLMVRLRTGLLKTLSIAKVVAAGNSAAAARGTF